MCVFACLCVCVCVCVCAYVCMCVAPPLWNAPCLAKLSIPTTSFAKLAIIMCVCMYMRICACVCRCVCPRVYVLPTYYAASSASLTEIFNRFRKDDESLRYMWSLLVLGINFFTVQHVSLRCFPNIWWYKFIDRFTSFYRVLHRLGIHSSRPFHPNHLVRMAIKHHMCVCICVCAHTCSYIHIHIHTGLN